MKVKISSVSYYNWDNEYKAPQPIVEVQSIDEAFKLIQEGKVYPQFGGDATWLKYRNADQEMRECQQFIVTFPKGNQEWRQRLDGREFDAEIELYDDLNE